MGRLGGKVALVTGAAKGLGQATAELFAAEGARVVLSDVDEYGSAVAAAIGPHARFERHDVTLEPDWHRVIGNTVSLHGRLDILVNNAGVFSVGTVESQTVDQWDRVIAVAAKGTFLGCKHAIGSMKATGGGAIVNVASIASLQGMPNAAAYCAAKGAVEALTRSAAVHCAEMKYGIRCNSLHPGSIDTPMVHTARQQMRDHAAAGGAMPARQGALTFLASPADIAEAILYLSSDLAKWVNGTRLVVDNGTSIMSVMSGTVPD